MAENLLEMLGIVDPNRERRVAVSPSQELDVFANPEAQGLEGSMLDPTMLIGMGGAKALDAGNQGLKTYLANAKSLPKGDIDKQKRLGAIALAVGGAKVANPNAIKNAVLDGISMGTRSTNPLSDVLDFVNRGQNSIAMARKTRMDKIAGKDVPEETAMSLFGQMAKRANRKANNALDFMEGKGGDVMLRELKRNPAQAISQVNRFLM